MTYRAICFDFDYTLGDCTDAIVAGFQHAFSVLGHPKPSRDAIRNTVGFMLEDAYSILTGINDPEEIEKFRPLFREVAITRQREEAFLFDGASELLLALHAQGIPLGIVSSKVSETIVYIMNRLNLGHTLNLVIGSSDVIHHKPHPEGLLSALNRMNVPPSHCLFCGDTIIDAETAQRAGVPFVAVLNGTTPAEAFLALPHVAICKDLWALSTFLGINIQNMT